PSRATPSSSGMRRAASRSPSGLPAAPSRCRSPAEWKPARLARSSPLSTTRSPTRDASEVAGESAFRDRRVLVTGGTGSIGSAIVEALLAEAPRVVRVLSRDDTKQFDLEQRHRGDARLRMLIGDVRNRERLQRAM